MKSLLLFIIFLFLNSNIIYSQNDSINYFSKEIMVTAGKDYSMSGFGEIFLGSHWRDLWTTPFEVGVLDLNKFGGGITPYKRGGGLQTKSLRFKGNDGKIYKFRSINKDPTRILPPDLQNTIFADAFQDQISTSHPLSALIVAPLLNAVGVLNVEPFVAMMPNDPKLGEYKKDFGNVLGTMEENPESGEEGELGFGESDKIINSYKLYKKLEKDNSNQVDKVEFLKARLIDLMIGDWDRHSDQWLWAAYKKDSMTIYRPIPRDRDQAFCLYDGLFPMITGRAITQIEGYGEDYPKIYNLSWNGRYVDRRFLPGVEKKVYDSLTAFIQSRLTNEVITNAVKKMPAEWYKLEGKNLVDMIKSRRNNLKDASDEYYELINETVEIFGSDKREFVEIKELGDDKVEIKMYHRDKVTGDKKSEPFFSRVFTSDETDEIRMYLNKGKDTISDKNYDAGTGINILIIKPDEKLGIKNSSLVNYDIYKDERPKNNPKERFEPLNEDRGYDWRTKPILNYNSDDGLKLGIGPILYKHGYGVKPYVYRMQLTGAYAFNAKSYEVIYTGDFYKIIKGAKTSLNTGFTQLHVTRYYGEGNETVLIDSLNDIDFYKIGQKYFYVNIPIEFPVAKRTSLSFTPFYKYSNVSYDQNTFLGQNPSTYGIGEDDFLGINSILEYDSRDNISEPFKGFYGRLLGNYTPDWGKNEFSFGKAAIDLRGYFSTDTVKGMTIALRGAGGKVWGTFPFYESWFLGGENSLKGFSRERFGGDGVLLGQTELRFRLFKVKVLIPGILGISLFGGTGRVFLQGEDSKRWHSSYGSSIWLSYLSRLLNVGFTAAKSDEGFKFFFGTALFL